MNGQIKPKKSLGQHFLRSEEVLNEILEAADISSKDTVLEVGPGEGVLTEKLLTKAGRVFSVEMDETLENRLQEQFAGEVASGKLTLISGDILDFDLSTIAGPYKVVANIPYYITAPIIKKLLTSKEQPTSCVLLVQKEVAERIVTKDGKESILSVSVKTYGEPSIIRVVSRNDFYPVPIVDSAVLKISSISRDFFKKVEEKHFWSVVRSGFAGKRKTLVNNLANAQCSKDEAAKILNKLGLPLTIRAEKVSLDNWSKIAIALEATRPSST